LRWVVSLTLLVWMWGGVGTAVGSAGDGTEVVRYHGYSVVVPAGWPVYDLARDPTVCVRFNRNAVYLGQPGSQQRCPARSVGRTEAILIEPVTGSGAYAPAVPPGASRRRKGGSPPRASWPSLPIA